MNWRTVICLLWALVWLGGCGVGGSPKEPVGKMIDSVRRADENALQNCFTYSDDVYGRLVDTCAAEVIGERKLEMLIRERFGQLVADDSQLNFSDHALNQLSAQLSDAEVSIDGQDAVVQGRPSNSGTGLNAVKLKHVKEGWKIDGDKLPSVADDATPAALDAFIQKSRQRTAAMAALAEQIQRGDVTTPIQLHAALTQGIIAPLRNSAANSGVETQPG